MIRLLFVSLHKAAKDFLFGLRKRLAVRQREQRGEIEGDANQLAHARRAPSLIDNSRSIVASQYPRDLHLLRFTQGLKLNRRAFEGNVERLLAR